MKSRKDFPFFLNELGLLGLGAEIGVAAGEFSRHILKHWKGRSLCMIDPYQYQGSTLDRSDTFEQHEANFKAASELCRQYRRYKGKPNAALFREFSVKFAEGWGNTLFDFVYIDAKHDYRSVMNDLRAWYPKVKPGGIIAGHDYKNSCVRKNLVEVKRAVDNFFYGLETVEVTTEDNLPTWYVMKSD